jgi:hypothetical protein
LLGWIHLTEDLPPEGSRYPQVDFKYALSAKRARSILTTGKTNPDTGSALPSSPVRNQPPTELTPFEICRIAEIGLKKEINDHEEVFITTGTRTFQIRSEYAWVLLIVKQVDGEDRFPLSRNRLRRVFPEYAMAYCGSPPHTMTPMEVKARNQERSTSGKFKTSAEKQAHLDRQEKVDQELISIKGAIREISSEIGKLAARMDVLQGQPQPTPVGTSAAPEGPRVADPFTGFEYSPQEVAEQNRRHRELEAANPFQLPQPQPARSSARAPSIFDLGHRMTTPTPPQRGSAVSVVIPDPGTTDAPDTVGPTASRKRARTGDGSEDAPVARRRSERLSRGRDSQQ